MNAVEKRLMQRLERMEPLNQRVIVALNGEECEISRELAEHLRITHLIIRTLSYKRLPTEDDKSFEELCDVYRELYGTPGNSGGYRWGVPGGAGYKSTGNPVGRPPGGGGSSAGGSGSKAAGGTGKSGSGGGANKGTGDRPRDKEGKQGTYKDQVKVVVNPSKTYFGAGEEAASERFSALHPELSNKADRLAHAQANPYGSEYESRLAPDASNASKASTANGIVHSGSNLPYVDRYGNVQETSEYALKPEYVRSAKQDSAEKSHNVNKDKTERDENISMSKDYYNQDKGFQEGGNGRATPVGQEYNPSPYVLANTGAMNPDGTSTRAVTVAQFKQQVASSPEMTAAIRGEQTAYNNQLKAEGKPVTVATKGTAQSKVDKATMNANVQSAAKAAAIADANFYKAKMGADFTKADKGIVAWLMNDSKGIPDKLTKVKYNTLTPHEKAFVASQGGRSYEYIQYTADRILRKLDVIQRGLNAHKV